MRLTVYDSRSLGISVLLPVNGIWWEWGKATWTFPFDQARHIRRFTPISNPGNLVILQQILTVDYGSAMVEFPGAVPVIWMFGTDGVLVRPISVNELVRPGQVPWPA